MTAVVRQQGRLLAATALAAALVAITVGVALTPIGARWNGDVQLFHQYAGAYLDGVIGQGPFLSWYPPLTLVPITLPRLLAADLGTYTFLFAIEMSLLAGVLLLVSARTADRLGASWVVAMVAGLALMLAMLIPARYDMVPALATAGALLAAVSGGPLVAGALLGLGAALKVYPAVLLPVLLLWLVFRGERRGAVSAFVGFGLVAGAGFALYWLFPPLTPRDLLAFQGSRPLQLESLPATAIGLASMLGVTSRPEVAFGDGSYNILGPAADVGIRFLSVLEPVLILVALVGMGWRAARDRRRGGVHGDVLVIGIVAVLLAVMLGNRVFSPQYLIWLLPFVVFLPSGYRPWIVAAVLLTVIIFPFSYDSLIALEPLPLVLLAARNLLLIGIFVAVLVELVRGGHSPDHLATDGP